MTYSVTYDRGYGGLTLSADQLVELEAIRDQQRDESDSAVGVGVPIYEALFEMISVKVDGEIVPKPGCDRAVWLWIRGAKDVNAGEGFYGDFIREYTKIQYQLRDSGDAETAEQLNQLASNQIAFRLADDILTNGGTLPGIEGLGAIDAGAAASEVFSHMAPHPSGDYAPWAGTLLFPYLGYDRFSNELLLQSESVVATMPNGEKLTIKNISGTYDLVAAVYASQEAGKAAFGDNRIQGFLNLWGPDEDDVVNHDPTQLIYGANAFFDAYYGLTADDSFDPGDDLPFANWASGFGENYVVGSYGDDAGLSIAAGDDALHTGYVVHAGLGDDLILGDAPRDFSNALIDGGDGVDEMRYQSQSGFRRPYQKGNAVRINSELNEGSYYSYRLEVKKSGGLTYSDYLYSVERLVFGVGDDVLYIDGIDAAALGDLREIDLGEGGFQGDLITYENAEHGANIAPINDVTFSINDESGASAFVVVGATRIFGSRFGDTVDVSGLTVDVDAHAGDGADTLSGGAGNDTFYGGAGGDTLQGGAGNDTLLGGAESDTYVYEAGDGHDIIEDSSRDAAGGITADRIVVDGAELAFDSGRAGLNSSNQRVWTTEDGQFSYTLVAGTLDDGTLVVSGAGLAGGTLTLNRFTNGRFGLNLDGNPAVAISGSAQSNPWADPAYIPQTETGELTEGGGRTLFVALNRMAVAGERIIVSLNGNVSDYSVVTGDQIIPLTGGSVELPLVEGQTSLAFALLHDGDVDGTENVLLTASFVDSDGNTTAADYNLTVTGADEAGEPEGDGASIVGDLRWKDFDADEAGIQTRNDALGNKIYDEDELDEPGQEDFLYDSVGNDSIHSGGGNDDINAFRGGNDLIDGGAGRDAIGAGAGDDVVIGGADGDVIMGNDGDDRLYADDRVDTAAAMADGASAPSVAAWGDFLSGNDGRDTLVGGNARDLLAGGDGDDVLIAGGGDDYIFGDEDYKPQTLAWHVETTTVTVGDNVSYTDTVHGGTVDNAAAVGNDRVHAGAGNDVVSADGGDDLVFGEAGDDRMFGDAGADTLLGGAGADLLHGDNGAGQVPTAEHGADFLDGGVGDDKLYGGGKSDSLFGGAGDDLLVGDDVDSDAGDDYLDGEAGDELLFGAAGHDTLYGGEDNDALYGDSSDGDQALQGDDYLDGESGDDLLVGGGGADMLVGGLGADELHGDGGDVEVAYQLDDYLDGGAGDDILVGYGGNDHLLGGSDNDQLFGDVSGLDSAQHGDDYLDGGAGADILVGSGGEDTLLGGDGDDQLWGDSSDTAGVDQADDYLDGGAGNDSLVGNGGADLLEGGDGNDLLWGDGDTAAEFHGDDSLFGGAGDDQLVGGGGNDTLMGGEGVDSLYGDRSDLDPSAHGNDYLYGDAGADTLVGFGGDDTLLGGVDDDVLYGDGHDDQATHGNDFLDGEQGDDLLVGGGGDDSLSGGDGDDRLYGDGSDIATQYHGDDYLSGGAGADVLVGYGGNDILDGGADADQLIGGAGDDYLIGGAGDDLLSAGSGNDVLTGGEGVDVFAYNLGDGVDVITDSGSNTLRFGSGIFFSGLTLGLGSLMIRVGDGDEIHIEQFNPDDPYGTYGVDRFEFADGTVVTYAQLLELGFDLDGTDGNDFLVGTALTDRLAGFGGDDTIIGKAGADVLDGGSGADRLIGGAGDDLYLVDEAGDVVVEAVDAGRDRVETALDYTLGANVEDLTLLDGGLAGVGNSLANTLRGNAAANQLQGLEGDDQLWGEAGDDTLAGGSGADALHGGAGNDSLDGGAGTDYLAGGGGNDVYRVDEADDQISELAGGGNDTVRSTASYALSAHLERLELEGDYAFDGTGNDGDNVIVGNALDNTLSGLGGQDTLFGGAGNDTLIAGDEADRLVGGTGDDTYEVQGASSVEIVELSGEGTDTVRARGDHALAANVENLVLLQAGHAQGNALANIITGSDGADVLDGGAGADTLVGGGGNDFFVVDDVADAVVEAQYAGTDTVSSSVDYTLTAHVENLTLIGAALLGTGNALHNSILGNGSDNTLAGLGGNDVISAYAGNDILSGGDGNDRLYGGAGQDTLDGGWGNDELYGGSGIDTLRGGQGWDTYYVEDTGDVIVELAGEGHDRVRSSATYTLSANIEELELTGWADIDGTGNALSNRIWGNSGSNTLYGGAGSDILDGGAGADAMYGGAHSDDYIVDHSGDTVIESAGEGTDHVASSVSFVLGDNVEHLTLTGDGWISGTGNALNNRLRGNDYRNVLSGLAGADDIDAGGGNDDIYGGDGDDYLYGGDDAVIAEVAYGGYEYGGYYYDEELGEFVEYGYGGSEYETCSITPNADYIDGGAGNDYIDGGSGDDTLYGGAGNDYLYGGDDGLLAGTCDGGEGGYDGGEGGYDGGEGGYDGGEFYPRPLAFAAVYDGGESFYGGELPYGGEMYANSNNDYLNGGAGTDTLDGGSGDDDLYGGADADSLYGGAGNDYLNGGTELDQMAGGAGNDVYVVDGYSEIITTPGDGGDGGTGGEPGTEEPGDDHDCTAGHKGNEGVGNGEDPPPPGHDTNWNDGPGTGPGNPGSKGGANAGVAKGSQGGAQGYVGGADGGCGTDAAEPDTCDGYADFGIEEADGSAPTTSTVWHTDTVTEYAGNGYDVVYSSVTYTLTEHVEELRLIGSADIDGTGNAQANLIFGNAGANVLDGGAGADVLNGGAGDDTYHYDGTDTLLDSAGVDTVVSAVSYALAAGFENLVLVAAAGEGSGNAAANALAGNALDNVLSGLGGDDVLSGAAGNDLLLGGAGADTYVYRIGEGVDRIEDADGGNRMRFGEHLTATNVAVRLITDGDGVTTAQLRLRDNNGNDIADQGVDFELNADGSAPLAAFDFADGSSATLAELLVRQETRQGSRRGETIALGRHDDSVFAGGGHDTVSGGAGADILYGEAGRDDLFGEAGNDTLAGGADADSLNGGYGFDLLDGGDGDDGLYGACQSDLLLGGAGNDSLRGGQGSDILAGGHGADDVYVDSGRDIVLFNAGDGADTLTFGTQVEGFALSVGGGARLEQLALSRNGDDLVLEIGTPSGKGRKAEGDRIALANWFADADADAGVPAVSLQVIAEAAADFDAGGADPLRASRVQSFDLTALAAAFEASGADRWQLMDSLLDAHLDASDSEALGGQIAYRYGLDGSTDALEQPVLLRTLEDPRLGQQSLSIAG